jgi:hypothetical protein
MGAEKRFEAKGTSDNLTIHIVARTHLGHAADHGINFATNPDANPATPARPTITHQAPLAQATRPSKGK